MRAPQRQRRRNSPSSGIFMFWAEAKSTGIANPFCDELLQLLRSYQTSVLRSTVGRGKVADGFCGAAPRIDQF
jgi:hypothetical protein